MRRRATCPDARNCVEVSNRRHTHLYIPSRRERELHFVVEVGQAPVPRVGGVLHERLGVLTVVVVPNGGIEGHPR